MKEIWENINGYKGKYQISNLGRVKSLYIYKIVHGELIKHHREHLMSPTDNGNGYLIVSLRKNRKRKNHYIHRLVASHFIRTPKDKEVVNHIDYDTKNNIVSNLQWLTQKENIQHSRINMTGVDHDVTGITGEKYISYRKSNARFRVTIKRKEIGTFKSLKDAVTRRDEYISEKYIR